MNRDDFFAASDLFWEILFGHFPIENKTYFKALDALRTVLTDKEAAYFEQSLKDCLFI